MRLIDGDELYQKVVGYNGGAVDKTVAKRLIDQMPTIDAVSRQAAIDAIKTCELGCEVDAIEALPSAQPEIIYCKDCRWGREACGNIECFADTNVPPEYHGYEWFCPNGERREDAEIH